MKTKLWHTLSLLIIVFFNTAACDHTQNNWFSSKPDCNILLADTSSANDQIEQSKKFFAEGENQAAVDSLNIAEKILHQIIQSCPQADSNLQLKWIQTKLSIADGYRIMLKLDTAYSLFREIQSEIQTRLSKTHPLNANALMGLGTLEATRGNFRVAYQIYNQAAQLLERDTTINPMTLAKIYNNLGSVISDQGDYGSGIYYYQKSLRLKERLLGTKNANTFSNYANIGDCYFEMQDFDKAEAYFKDLQEVVEKRFPANAPVQCFPKVYFGALYLEAGRYPAALQQYKECIGCYGAVGGTPAVELADAYLGLGKTQEKLGDFIRARQNMRKAEQLYATIYGAKHQQIADAKKAQAELKAREGKRTEALYEMQGALTAFFPNYNKHLSVLNNPGLESFRQMDQFVFELMASKANLLREKAQSSSDKAKYLEAALRTYELLFDALAQARTSYNTWLSKFYLNQESEEYFEQAILVALELAELTENRTFISRAYSVAARNKAGILVEHLKDASAKKISGLPEDRMSEEASLAAQIGYVNQLIFEEEQLGGDANTQQISIWKEELFRLNRRREKLLESFEKQSPQYVQLKYQTLDLSTAQLQNWLPDEKTIVVEFFSGKNTLYAFVVSKTQCQVFTYGKKAIEKQVQAYTTLLKDNHSTEDRIAKTGYKLYELLLVPIIEKFDHQNWILIPDGILAQLPFGALITRRAYAGKNFDELSFLLLEKKLSYELASPLMLATNLTKRTKGKRTYLGFAPGFAGQTAPINLTPDTLRKGNNTALQYLSGTQREVEAVKQIIGGNIFQDNLAQESIFKQEAPGYQILHLATHAIIHPEEPLYNHLALAAPDNQGEDAQLFAQEIANLKLTADLVVLSSCVSGVGKDQPGEGMMSLARAFRFAGTRSQVMSLWEAHDESTRLLVVQFFKHLKRGESQMNALQLAQREFIQNPSNHNMLHPFYWAGLEVVGEEQALYYLGNQWMWYLLIVVVLLGLVWQFLKSRKKIAPKG